MDKSNVILVMPDVHGREFWKDYNDPVKVKEYEKIVFLGDYLDPYHEERISVPEAIENFKEIIEFKRANAEKVVLLLGNHDMPYYSKEYFEKCGPWFCRHDSAHHDEIAQLFNDNKELFQLVYVHDDVVFSHAGFRYDWVMYVYRKLDDLAPGLINLDRSDFNKFFMQFNKFLDSGRDAISLLDIASSYRGDSPRRLYGKWYNDGSCIWADVREFSNKDQLEDVKQVFGHTRQVEYDQVKQVFGKVIKADNYMMLDNGQAHELDLDTFELIY